MIQKNATNSEWATNATTILVNAIGANNEKQTITSTRGISSNRFTSNNNIWVCVPSGKDVEMREIKFRVWVESVLPEETGLYYPNVLQLGDDGLVDKIWTEDYKFTGDTCKFTLLQYSNLKDKNGVEIYEGDIVKTVDGYPATVSYDETKAEFDPFGSGEGAEWGDGVEVIGNIYENKELLT